MASASEPTSCFFAANLGALDPAVVERLERWAAASCGEHALRRHEDGSVTLYAIKISAKTARQYQSLLRTLTSHWKMTFGKLDRGWLTLLTESEYRAAIGGATDGEVAAASECAAARPHDPIDASAPAAPTQAEPGVGCVHLLSLSDGFDERAQALYDRLLANHGALQSRSAVCAA
jgi:hypothetical protein